MCQDFTIELKTIEFGLKTDKIGGLGKGTLKSPQQQKFKAVKFQSIST